MRKITLTLIGLMAAILIIVAAKDKEERVTPPGTYCVDVGTDAARVEENFGKYFRLKDENGDLRPATPAEMEAVIFDWVEGRTRDFEKQSNAAEFSPPPFGNAKGYTLPSPVP
jgi:hypothetical protein